MVTVLVGENTIGKTSILEAIFYLTIGKSFRASQDKEVIRWGEKITRIAGKIQSKSQMPNDKSQNQRLDVKNEETERLEVVFTDRLSSLASRQTLASQRKKFLVNGVGRRMVDFAGRLKAVLFRPEDLELITDSPSLRRRYLDFVLVQVDREYRRALLSYERGLRQRNRLLEAIRDSNATRSQLIFWDQLLIKNGNYISDKRREFIEYVNNFESQLGKYQIFYDDSQISAGRLAQYAEEEVAAGATLVGPHRDNFVVELTTNNKQQTTKRDLSVYGSRGEQRLAILWLKMRELEYIEEKTGERPILLLDDIFSELDHSHRKLVMEIVGKQQTIITTADKHYIEGKGEMEIIELKNEQAGKTQDVSCN